MPTLAIVSDTHIPARASEIPDWVVEAVRSADAVIHAGDFTSQAAYDRVLDLAGGNLTAVAGNMDDHGLGLSQTDTLELAGHEFVVTHGTGSPAGYEDRVREAATRAASVEDPIAVAGHTHSVLDDDDGIRILNPGSATAAPPAAEATMMVASVTPETVEVTVRRE
jgi:hypothetical protein